MSSYNDFAYIADEVLGTGLITGLLSGIPSGLISIATYVLTALALYTIAKRRGINKPWLAWIPVLDVWILGSIADQYRYVAKGEIKSKRKALLTLNILMAVLSAVVIGVAISMVVGLIGSAMYGASEEELLQQFIGPVLGVAGLSLPLAGVAIAYAVIYFMALYDVYTSCDPSNSVLFLVLSIVFGVTKPIFLLVSRNKDGGMPPRRPEPASYIPTPEPVQEPWEREDKDYL